MNWLTLGLGFCAGALATVLAYALLHWWDAWRDARQRWD